MASGLGTMFDQVGNGIANSIKGGVKSVGGYLGDQAQKSLAGGIKTLTGQLSQMNSGQPMTATGNTPPPPTTPSKGVLPVKNPPPVNPPPTAGDLQAQHQAKIDAITKQISDTKAQLATMGYNPDGTPIQTGTTPNPTSTMSSAAANAPTGGNATPSASNNPQYAAAIGGLSAVQQQNNPVLQADTQAINQAQQQYKNLSTEQTGGTVGGSAGPESGVTGIQSQFALNALNSAQEQYANDLAEQNAQIAAGQAVGGLTQPVGQFGVLTNPQTGQPINGQTAAEAAQQGGYIQGLQSGAQAQGAVGGTTNASNASATGTQAFNLDLALKQVDAVTPLLTNVMQAAGISNANSPLYTQPINTYISQLQNPQAYKSYQLFLQTLNKYTQQIIGAGGVGTPTGVQAAAALENPDGLSMAQIQKYLVDLNTDGQNQKAKLQEQTNQAGGSGIYTGSPASTSTNIAPTTANTSQNTPGAGATTPVGQYAAGQGLGLLSWAQGVASNLGPEIASFIAGTFKAPPVAP